MDQLIEAVLSTQRQLQGLVAGHILDLFSSVEHFAVGMAVAVALGLVHALTPGHGKAVIFSHFLGRPAGVSATMRVAAMAATTHGAIAVLLVLAAGRVISPLGRPVGAAAWLEVAAGAIVAGVGAVYVVLAMRGLRHASGHAHGPKASRPLLAVAMGLLPCPLTIIVVGSAVARGATAAGIALAVGISIGAAATIGSFGLLGIVLRRGGIALAGIRIRQLMRALGFLEFATSLLILMLGLGMLAASLGRLR